MKVLLINPPTPDTFWSFKHVLRLVSKHAAFPPLGLLTVAGMLPADWEIQLVDMNIKHLMDDEMQWADYVMLSAMVVHKEVIPEIVSRCHHHNKPVIAGGPLFTTGHAAFPDIDHFVLGEAEQLMPQLIEDMLRGKVSHTYATSNRPDITHVPPPRWDLIDFRHYVTLSVQFSRGCPFDCEFCDIIVMNGRIPRTKLPEQLVAELEDLRVRGWRGMVFVVDDNFIGNRMQAKSLLREIIQWRTRTGAKMGFLTEASADLAEDAELCDLMVLAGFKKVFVGFETPSLESLKECRKLQNCRSDLLESVKILQQAGLEVMGGFIVGFDKDPMDIFERQFEFIQRSGVVTAMVGLLTALPGTRLYHRLVDEGRIEKESTGNNTDASLNFSPILDREFLVNGYRELMKKLYEPKQYYQRIRTFLKNHKPKGPQLQLSRANCQAFVKSLWILGVCNSGRIAYWRLCIITLFRWPRLFHVASELAIIGYHFRKMAKTL